MKLIYIPTYIYTCIHTYIRTLAGDTAAERELRAALLKAEERVRQAEKEAKELREFVESLEQQVCTICMHVYTYVYV